MVFRGERSEDQSLPTEYKAGTIGNLTAWGGGRGGAGGGGIIRILQSLGGK